MKKLFALSLAAIMSISVAACGGGASSSAYKPGDTIETDLFKITPSFTGYAYNLSNWPDENYMTPAGEYSGDSPYNAGEEKVELYGEIQVEYIGNEKEPVTLELGISADFDDGYEFECVHFGYCTSLDGDWKYDSHMLFEPLSSSTTRTMRYCIEVPEQVEKEVEKPLWVTFTVNGKKFAYDFRSVEVLGSDYDPRAEFYQEIDETTKNQIISHLKSNGLVEMGWYSGTYGKTVGEYTFTFGDNTVNAMLPIVGTNYGYDFNGTYEIYSGTILLSWDHGEEMHLDYTFDGTTLDIIEFEHDR